MLYATAFTSLFAAIAAAAGAPPAAETIKLSEFTVRKVSGQTGSNVKAIYFKLNGGGVNDAVCEATLPGFPSPRLPCAGSNFGFSILPGKQGEYALRLFQDVAGTTLVGQNEVATVCHAGGNGSTDYVCITAGPSDIVIEPSTGATGATTVDTPAATPAASKRDAASSAIVDTPVGTPAASSAIVGKRGAASTAIVDTAVGTPAPTGQ